MEKFKQAVTIALQKYAAFEGRAALYEYWYFFLFLILSQLILGMIDGMLGIQILAPLAALVLIIPSISAAVRRLHDTDKSGWWLLLGLIPLVGLFVLYLLAQKGTEGTNQFGPPVA